LADLDEVVTRFEASGFVPRHDINIAQGPGRNPDKDNAEYKINGPDGVVDHTLLHLHRQGEARTRAQAALGMERRRVRLHRRQHTPALTHHNAYRRAVQLARGQRVRRVMTERGLDLPQLLRQSEPGLDAVQARLPREVLARAFRLHDATPGRHQVHLAGTDGLHEADAVVVDDLPLEQPSHGRETDVRVRPHLDALPRRER
jgi:hypothetical protein